MHLLLRIAVTPRNANSARTTALALAALPRAAGLSQQTGAAVSRGALRWSSSNSKWKQRQFADFYVREAKLRGLRSRAAFKLMEIDSKYKLFKKGQTVVDLGYAPGSWSQVAVERTKPHGRVVGIDLIPAAPPKGVSTIQGNFLSPAVQNFVKEYLMDMAQRQSASVAETADNEDDSVIIDRPSYIDVERAESATSSVHDHEHFSEDEERLVDVVLSDMSEPWLQTAGFSSRTLSNPYDRMMNTSGMGFRDHAGSMDLCLAALQFASDTLRAGGHFVCKFYQGSEDKALEMRLEKMFNKVHRDKPDSSRNQSREAYFVALSRKPDARFSNTEL